jgi:hypothetical protein
MLNIDTFTFLLESLNLNLNEKDTENFFNFF